jgi:ATP-dependent Clp protease ATP-binding subunit ClpC
MKMEFGFHSERARRSRFFVGFNRHIRVVLAAAIIGFSLAGVLVWLESPLIGSILVSIAIVLLLPMIWFEYDIAKMQRLPLTGKSAKVEAVLAPDVVGRLRSISNPYAIWAAIDNTWQQRFFAMRYGLGADVFNLLSKEKRGMEEVWGDAISLSQKHNEIGISTASLLVALLKTMPNYEQILADANLDLEELETSIDWLHHTEVVVSRLGKTKHAGGIARDWTSGFTPTLNQLAHNMTVDIEHGGFMHRDLDGHRETIDQLVAFMADGRQNAIMVGEVGVGKTITTYGFAQRLIQDSKAPKSIRYHQVFSIDPTSIIASSDDPNKVEALVTKIIAEAQKAKNVILFFDDAATFFAQGTGEINLGKILLPLIENNALPMVFAMTPSEWQEVSGKNKALAGVMNFLAVPEADSNHTMRVMEDQSLMIEAQHKVTITYQALKQADELSKRYVRDIAAPGRALRLLENSVNHAEGKFVTGRSVQLSVEATQGVKVQVASGVEKEELLNLETEIHKRMVNQNRAVKVVSDALRRARSGVNNPEKPIGTFMFLGPTGVGKTELAKAIAATYFGKEKNMVRVDMNEFTQSSDIERLLDTKSKSSLLASVGRNPFTVVLFDEIEKAHPEIVNVFLQLLDEGVMRDDKNREVSFRDAIIIATSNAGADSIRAYIDAGQEVEQFEKVFVDSLIDAHNFKPEFLNRFDEMVVFRPLKESELVKVVDLLIGGVNQTLSKQKVAVELTPAAKKWLAKQGYDPRLGARPLRRMVQRTVENVVAKKILKSDFKPGSTLKLDTPDLEAEQANG